MWEVMNWKDGKPNVVGLCEIIGRPQNDIPGVVAILNAAMFLDNVDASEVEIEGDSKCCDLYVRGFPALYMEKV